MSPTTDDLDRLLEHAVRAPSVLNSQPWRFAVEAERPGGPAVHLFADRGRQLAALDPDGRELTMSCGAALYYLRVAARHQGWQPTVALAPDPSDPDALATVTFEPGHRPGGDDRLFRALALRRTNRRPFRPDPVPFGVPAQLAGAASAEGAALHTFDERADKDRLADLVALGVREQGGDRALVDEVRSWLRPSRDPRPDGVRDSAQGEWDRHAGSRETAASVAAWKGRLVREAPAVMVLTTPADEPEDWLRAGQALARALVVGADRGLAASYANEPVEVEHLRDRLAEMVGAVPQALFRVGYPNDEPATARRPARDVVERDSPRS